MPRRRLSKPESRSDGFPLARRSLGEGGSRQGHIDGCPSRRSLLLVVRYETRETQNVHNRSGLLLR
jgi:hypothetical protein